MQQQETIQKSDTKQASAQRLALAAIQKQMQVLKLKELLVMGGFVGGGAVLRALMQPFPNIEPLTFLAVLTGWLFGLRKGIVTGASLLYVSNYIVFGGQGPWTIYQTIGYGIAGAMGALLRKKASIIECVLAMIGATIMLQITFNVGWALSMGFPIIPAFFTAIPFIVVHLVSNSVFGLFLPMAKKFVEKRGGFDGREVCEHVLGAAKSSRFGRLLFGKKRKHT